MKLCQDCKHCDLILTGHYKRAGDYSKCNHPSLKNASISPVTGILSADDARYCNEVRLSGQECGPDAILFEPNEAYAEYLRDKKIDGNQEARRERAISRYRDAGQEFETEQGARE